MKISYLFYACSVAALLSCAEKRDGQGRVALSAPDVESTDGIHRMSDYHFTDTVRWRGSVYEYTVVRLADDSLGTVTDTDGMQYVENSLSLTVAKDGQRIFARAFTKPSLANHIDGGFLRNNIIEGLAFNRSTDEGLCFALSVGLPLSDEYVQLRVTVNANGDCTIRRDEIVDYNLADDDSLGLAGV